MSDDAMTAQLIEVDDEIANHVENGDEREIGDDEEGPEGSASHDFEQILSHRKQRQQAAFDAWFDQKARSPTKADVAENLKKSENEELLSLKDLMAMQQSQHIITSPREYQTELFERAKRQNTIAVLDTGSGKTLIAVLLLRHVIDEELERRGTGNQPRISFFLVDKVALVFQQFAVLETNLDQNITHLCGSMGVDLWTRDIWHKHFNQNMIIVCTADILLHCLFHSFITIDQINLLIFDEAHHAKKEHAYARIIKEFYLTQHDVQKRPRIFGMTASPVDVNARDDVLDKAWELERLLHAQIATASDMNLLRKSVNRPEEQVLRYQRPPPPFETKLYQQLWAQFRDIDDFSKLFDRAKIISSELGRWCADAYWSFAFSERAKEKIETRWEHHGSKTGSQVDAELDSQGEKKLDAQIERLESAHEALQSHVFGTPSAMTDDLSSKVLTLYQHLQLYYERPTGTKCLVFVQTRATARLLKLVFDHIGGEHLRPGVLIGAASASGDGLEQTIKQQVLTLQKFRNGELNCLFATSVAEEGVDIQDCNLVIRFDRCQTMIQYIQSRGRARHQNSKFVHLVEFNNALHADQLKSIKESEGLLRKFCESLPEDRLLKGSEHDIDDIRDAHRSQRFYVEPSTGAKLTYDFSLVVLAHFVSALPHHDEDNMSIEYAISLQAGKYICEVILPTKSPIRSVIGQPESRKSIAKRSAAFSACIQLRKGKFLNEFLLPVYAKQAPAMRNAQLALESKKLNAYDVKLKPDSWKQGRPGIPSNLYVNIFSISGTWDRGVEPLALLSRIQLPETPPFPVFSLNGVSSSVNFMHCEQILVIDEAEIRHLTTFTLTIFKDIFNKEFEIDPSKMSYWLAPVVSIAQTVSGWHKDPKELINWDLLDYVHNASRQKWSEDMPNDELLDKFFIDIWDGGRRFFSNAIASNLQPHDPVPADTATGRRKDSILDFTVSLFKKARQARTWNPYQPVLEAEKTQHRLNVLAKPTQKEQKTVTRCFVCPEPLEISLLPPTVVAMALIFPAIIYRVESYLIADEFTKELGVSIHPRLALEALTKDSDNTEEAHEIQVNVRRGMGPNYERLEFIGDCFLKMATSIAIFAQYAHKDQFAMHVDRMLMLTNKNLFENSCKRGWPRHIRGLAFSRRTWYPEGLKLLCGKGANKEETESPHQQLSDKTIADVCEAMIGAALMTFFEFGNKPHVEFSEAVKLVTEFVDNDNHKMKEWRDYYNAYTIPAYQTGTIRASMRDLARKVECKHSYQFRYPRLLCSAFQHPSHSVLYYGIPSYERLEFLGDSLLDMTAVAYLFRKFPTKDPQWLTEHKMAMVSNKFLGALCVKLGFHRHLRMDDTTLPQMIKEYVTEIKAAEENSDGARDYWTLAKDPPKCLPDIVESYVGAIFVDSEFNYAEVQRFFEEHIIWFFEDMSIYDTFANNHPIKKLYKLLSQNMGCQDYRLLSREMPSVDGTSRSYNIAGVVIHEQVVGKGEAEASRNAKIRASVSALKSLDGLPPFEFRLKYGCGCTGETPHADLDGFEEAFGTAI